MGIELGHAVEQEISCFERCNVWLDWILLEDLSSIGERETLSDFLNHSGEALDLMA